MRRVEEHDRKLFLTRVRLAQTWGLSLKEVDDLTLQELTWLNNEQRRLNLEQEQARLAK